jgi:hypothetical protein
MLSGLARISPQARDVLMQLFGLTRAAAGILPLRFEDGPPVYLFDRDIVLLPAKLGSQRIMTAISREALDNHFGTDRMDAKGRVSVVRQRRAEIERLAATKYADWPIEDLEMTLIKTNDVPRLRAATMAGKSGTKRKL